MRAILGVVVAAAYVVPVSRVGLRTDLGGHIRFAESIALSGREFGPSFLFHQLAIIVRALIPFGFLGGINERWGERAVTWNVAGVLVVLGFVVWLAQVVFDRLRPALSGVRPAVADRAAFGATVVVVLAGPLTFLTWNAHHLVIGYLNITMFDSPTNIMAKPLALVLYLILVRDPGAHGDRRSILIAAAITLAGMHNKPSYAICLLPALAACEIWARARRRRFGGRLMLLGCVVPVAAYLAYSFGAYNLYLGEEIGVQARSGVSWAPGRIIAQAMDIHNQSGWFFVVLLAMSVAFPVVVTALASPDRRAELGLAWLVFGVALAQYSLFTVGGRQDFGDLAWGAQISLFILFVECIRILLGWLCPPPVEAGPGITRSLRFDARSTAASLLLAAHLACGLLLLVKETTDPAQWW